MRKLSTILLALALLAVVGAEGAFAQAAKIRVETLANGSGTVVSAQSLASGSPITVYAIARDTADIFVANVAATWTLPTTTGGVVSGDLVPAGGNKSAVFTGHVTGTAVIRADSASLPATPSGTITVTAGTATKLRVETDVNGNGTVVPAQNLPSGSSLTVYAISRDASDNFVANIGATWSFVSVTGGVIASDLVPDPNTKSATMTGHLPGTAQINASSGGLAQVNSGTVSVTTGAATKVRVETAANGTGTIVPAQNLPSGSSLTVYAISRDASDNFVANVAASWSLQSTTGGVIASDLVPDPNTKSATMTGHLPGTAQINASSGGLAQVNSGTVSVIPGAATKVRVETAANGTGTIVPAQNLTSGSAITVYAISRDASDTFVANVAASWSLQSTTGGVVSGDLVPNGGNKSAVLTGHLTGSAAIRADSASLSATQSGTITVTSAPATRLVLRTGVGDPSATFNAGQAQNLLITAKDALGNTDTTYAGSKSLTFSGPDASPSPVTNPTVSNSSGTAISFTSPTSINFVKGVATVTGGTNNGVMLLYRAQSDIVSVTDGTRSSSGGDRLTVNVSSAGLSKFAWVLASPQVNGVAFTGGDTLKAQDDWGNIVAIDAQATPVVVTTSLGGTVTGLGSGANNILNQSSDFASGNAVLTGKIKYTGAIGSGTFTATGGGKNGTSSSVTINAGAATRLVVRTLLGDSILTLGAGVAQGLKISAIDGSGNPASGYTGVKSLTFSGAGVSPAPESKNPTIADNTGSPRNFSATTQITFTNGVATASAGNNGVLRLYKVEAATVGVTDGAISALAGDRLSVTVTPAGLNRFAVGLTSPQINGATFDGVNTIAAIDSFGNVATGFNASTNPVTVSPVGLTGTVSGLGSAGNNILNRSGDFVAGIADVTGAMKYTGTVGNGTFSATSAAGGKTGSSGNVLINVGNATRLVVTGSGSQVAGSSQSLTITARDSSGNVAASYTGDKSIRFSGSGPSPNPATPPKIRGKDGADYSFGAQVPITFVSGVAQASAGVNGVMFLYRAGKDTISITDGSIGSGGTDRLIVTTSEDALQKFAFSLSSPQQSGVAFQGTNTLTAQDNFGNTVTGFNAPTDPVRISTNLSGTVTGLGSGANDLLNQSGDFTNGVATLTGKLVFTGPIGTGLFNANSSTSKVGTSGSVSIVAGGATRLVLGGVGSMVAGGSQGLTITAKDASGNTVPAYTGAKSLIFSGADSSLAPASPPTVTTNAGSPIPFGAATNIIFTNGVATASGNNNGVLKLLRAQSVIISVTDGVLSSNGTDRLPVTVTPAGLGKFVWSLASPQISGIPFTGANTLTAQDDWGNIVTGFDASATNVTVSSTLSGSITGLGSGSSNVLNRPIDFSGGTANLTALLMKYTGAVGSGTFTATGGGKSGTSAAVLIQAGSATRLVLRTSVGDSVTTRSAGSTISLTITAKDGAGNTVSTYAGVKNLTFSGADSALNPAQPPTVTSNSGAAIPFGVSTGITFTSGVAQVSGSTNGVMTLYRAQAVVINVVEGTRASTGTDRLSVTVNPAALGKFTMVLASPQTNGVAFTGVNSLTAQDSHGNTLTGFDASGSNVTITTTLTGTIVGLGTGNDNVLNRASDFLSGVANLTSLGMKFSGSVGAGIFTATSAGKASNDVTVQFNAGSAGKLVITGAGTQTAGSSQNLTITAKDATDNVVPGYTGNKTLIFSGAAASGNPVVQPTVTNNAGVATPLGAPTVIAFASGVATVSGGANGALKLYKAETATISVHDDSIASAGPERLTVAVSPAALGQFAWSLASPQTNGVAFTGTNTLTAEDDWGNIVPTFNASANNVTITSSLSALPSAVTGLGTLGNNVLNQAANFTLGVANLTALGMQYKAVGGSGTFTATSAVGSKSGTSPAVTFNNPAPTILTVSPAEASRLQSVIATITGTNFLSGVTVVDLGTSATVDSIVVETPTRLTARIRPGIAASTGLTSVAVTNPAPGGGTMSLPNAFTVKNIPTIIGLSPNSGFGGQPVAVTITGTNFANGVSTVGTQGASITVDSAIVANPGTIIAYIRISAGAPDGIRSFTVTNSGTFGGTSNAVSFTVGNNPVPVITSITPSSVARLQSPVDLTIRGTGFFNGITSVRMGQGINVGATVVDSSTQMRVTVGVMDSAAAGQRNVFVTNSSPGGGTDTLFNGLTVTNPPPTLTGLSPQNGIRLQPGSVTLTGTRFIKNVTTANFGSGISVSTNSVESPTQMRVDFTIDSSAALGVRNVVVANPAPAGGTDTLKSAFTVSNPSPTVTSISPESTKVGTAALLLTVDGTGFVPGSVIEFGGLTLSTTLVNRTRLTATIPASALDTARSFVVGVNTPLPGGGASNVRNFTIQNPAPTLTNIAPTSGSRLATLNVVFAGTNFIPGISQVDFGTPDITVNSITVDTSTRLNVNVRISGTAVIGPRDVFVFNPAPGGGASEKRVFSVANNPAPTISAVSPASGSRLQTLDVVVDGTNFISGVTSVDFGTGIVINPPVVINSATRLTANVTISAAAPTGARSITVTNAAPGGGPATRTNAFTVVNPMPEYHSIAPSNGQQLKTLNVVINGEGFIEGVSSVSLSTGITINGQNVVNDTLITANITITINAVTGVRDVWVTNQPPGGGTAVLTNGFVVGDNPRPTLKSTSPATAKRLETLNIVFLGSNFVSGVTSVDLGPDVVVNGVTVDSSTGLTANVTVAAKAATGQRTAFLTNAPPGGGKDSLLNAFTITNPLPTLTSIIPAGVQRLETRNVVLRGSNFISGTTVVNFGANVRLNSTTVDSASKMTVNITADSNAITGARNVSVSNPLPGGGTSGLVPFTISLAPPPAPVLNTPSNGAPNLPTTPVLKWDAVTGATFYHLQVSASSVFLTTVVDDSTLTTNSRRVGPLTNNQTYYWRVRAKNAGGTSQFSSTWSFTPSYPTIFNASHTTDFPVYSAASQYQAFDYRIVGLPGTGTEPVSSFIQGTQGADWQLYWDNGAATGEYLQIFNATTSPFSFSAGRAYWLVRKGPWSVSTTVNSAPLDTTGSVAVPLHTGWNLITNPFWLSIKWTDVQSVNGNAARSSIWAYNGTAGWVQSTNLEPYVGYYFLNSDGVLALRIPYGATTGVLKTADTAGEGAWRVGISVFAGKCADHATWFGVAADAQEGLDNYDEHKPRGVADLPGAWFDRPDMDHTYHSFATDIRPPVKTLARWTFDVRSAAKEETRLLFGSLDGIPKDLDVYLVDQVHARFADLRKSLEYRFTAVTPTSQFTILVGTHEAVAKELSEVVPREFALGTNFPNPFNPSTTLPVSIPYTANVTLTVFSILGEEIRTVHSGVLEAGRYWMVWDGRNEGGRTVATGVYIARLSTPAGAGFVTKMLLMK